MIVAKFGGTSVSSKESVLTLCNIVGNEINRRPVIVVSALSGVTDLLLSLSVLPKSKIGKKIRQIRNLHNHLIKSLWNSKDLQEEVLQFIDTQLEKIAQLVVEGNSSGESLDKLVSFGEIMSSFIIARVLENEGIKAAQVIATDLIITSNNFGAAEFILGPTKKRVKQILTPLIKANIVPVVTGFIGSTKTGQVTTLGRGGSDYTASIIGFCLKVSEIQIWTDVDGIMTADPKIVKDAGTIDLISYEEASELAILGAKVLHPKSIFPAIEKNIPVRILNTHNPVFKGTTILKEVSKQKYITSIACKKNVKVVHIHTSKMFGTYGFLHKVFNVFDKLKISVDFVSTSEVSISVTINGKYSTVKLIEELEKIAKAEVRSNRATVSVVGRPPGIMPAIQGKVYTILENKKIEVEMISAGASKVNETVVVKEEDADEVVKILHQTFFGV